LSLDKDKLILALARYTQRHPDKKPSELGEVKEKTELNPRFGSREWVAKKAFISASLMSGATSEGLSVEAAESVAGVLEVSVVDLVNDTERAKLPRFPKPNNSWHVPYCIHFRGKAEITEEYYLKPLSEPGEVSIATIMTKESFEKGFDGLGANTKLNVYIWKPRTADEIIAVGKHESRGLVDTPILIEAKIDQVRRSLAGWAKRAKENGNIKVKTYDWMPAIKIVMWHGKAITVEIMTYNTNTKFRPCLLLRKNDPQEAPVFAEYEQQIKWFDEHGIGLLDENKEIRDKPLWF
jgi:hypothetical protein